MLGTSFVYELLLHVNIDVRIYISYSDVHIFVLQHHTPVTAIP